MAPKSVSLISRHAGMTQAVKKVAAASGVKLNWETPAVGTDSVASVQRTHVGLFVGKPDEPFRKDLELYANIRPCRTFEGHRSPVPFVDLVLVYENSSIPNSEQAEALAHVAFGYAARNARQKLTVGHGAGDSYLSATREVAKDYPQIIYEERTSEDVQTAAADSPEDLDVVLCPAPSWIQLREICIRNIGGPGIAPGCELADDCLVFTAEHPTAALLATAMMLDQINEGPASDRVLRAVKQLIMEREAITPDLGGPALLTEMVDEVCRLIASN